MKNLLFVLLSASVMFWRCDPAVELQQKEALQIINKELGYPRVVDYDIFCGDPAHAKRLLDAGLETEGMVTVQKTQKLKDIGNPLIQFTEKANPYLLPTANEDKALNIQKVKIANEEVEDIRIIRDEENRNIVWVEYTSVCKNITPFSALVKRSLNEPARHRVRFSLSDDGWILQRPIR